MSFRNSQIPCPLPSFLPQNAVRHIIRDVMEMTPVVTFRKKKYTKLQNSPVMHVYFKRVPIIEETSH